MATEQDIVKALTDQTESGKLEWAPTAKSRWNSEMRGCRFSLMSNAVDILDRNENEWYRYHLSTDELKPLIRAVKVRFPSQDREDEVLASGLKCLLGD